jgi:streptogramin lyase
MRPDRLMIRTGDYFNPDYTPKLDGALASFDPASGTISDPILTEADFGMNLSALVGNADGNALLIADDAYSWNVFCVNLETMEVTDTPFVDSYIGEAVASPDGQVWVAYRAGYAGTGDPVLSGLVRWDPATCTAEDPIASVFPPYSLALLP